MDVCIKKRDLAFDKNISCFCVRVAGMRYLRAHLHLQSYERKYKGDKQRIKKSSISCGGQSDNRRFAAYTMRDRTLANGDGHEL